MATAVKGTKKVATKAATKKTETKKVNAEKKSVDMAQINKMITDAGIKIANPDAKGNYRIFGGKKGSSLNVQKSKFIIYSTDEDFAAVEKAKIAGVEIEKGANSQDKARPNVVRVTAIEVLQKLLAVYAKNGANRVVAEK